MPNYPTHILSGAIASFVLAFVLFKTGFTNPLVLTVGFILGVIASEFPDIDQKNSIPRKVLRTYFPALVIIAFVYLFFKLRVWTKDILYLIGFVAIPVIIILTYEKFIPRHRGAIHKLPGLIMISITTLPIGILLNANLSIFLILELFVFIGFSTHILLDNIL
ncbi:MAG: metal-dependent hydrolase [Nanoarchaeota archaeon]|nr:metal-dependent hydrolase [Nanoarchaeota archaeon]